MEEIRVRAKTLFTGPFRRAIEEICTVLEIEFLLDGVVLTFLWDLRILQ
jgi:hypothetical protein